MALQDESKAFSLSFSNSMAKQLSQYFHLKLIAINEMKKKISSKPRLFMYQLPQSFIQT